MIEWVLVEQERTEEGGGGKGKLAMASSSSAAANQSPMPKKEAARTYLPYPPPLAKYEDVVINPKLFLDTLEKLHATMGTKFIEMKQSKFKRICVFCGSSQGKKSSYQDAAIELGKELLIPIIGGKDLDLHRLFVEVTTRGGIEKILKERRWKEVTAVFSFPSTATNASFVLRKYYGTLLHHYEQIYFFKAKGWSPSVDPSQSLSSPPVPPRALAEPVLPSPPMTEFLVAGLQPLRTNVAEFSHGETSAPPSTGTPAIGVIDGKFETGYLVTVRIGSELLKGVLYMVPQNPGSQVPQHQNASASNNDNNTPAASGMSRRRRRKKSEMKKRDPAHPKPNRSGYNFFFAEQHARLKPLHPGKDREISRMIGELWTKMKEPEKAVYQDRAVKDKERYRTEMEDYRERLRTGQIISNAVPIQQRSPVPHLHILESSEKIVTEGGESPQTPENEISSKSDSEDKSADKDSDDAETSPGVEFGAENMGMEDLVDKEGFELHPNKKRAVNKAGDESLENSNDIVMQETKKDSVAVEEKGSMPSEGKEPLPSDEQRGSVSSEAKEAVHSEDQ
ncbi:unnamed protein product [Camellia sinensis]